MIKKNKYFKIGIISIVGIVIILLLLFRGNINDKYDEIIEERNTTYEEFSFGNDYYIKSLEKGKYICISGDSGVPNGTSVLEDHYILVQNRVIMYKYIKGVSTINYDENAKYEVNIYDIEDASYIKSIDVLSLIQGLDSNLLKEYLLNSEIWGVEVNGKNYINIQLTKYLDEYGENRLFCELYIDIESEEITVEPWKEDQYKNFEELHKGELLEKYKRILLLKMTNIMKINNIDEIFIYKEYKQNSVYQIGYPYIKYLDKKSKIADFFPELQEMDDLEEKRTVFYITGDPTATELLQLLLPEGQEIKYEGVILEAEDSIDGKEHEIHSEEEFWEYFYTENENLK